MGSATEWADKSTNEIANAPHTASGSVVYSDANSLDLHTATVTPQGSGYLGTFSLNTSAIDTGDSVGWSFVVSDSAIDYLKAGQTKTQLYDVTINDGHGGTIVQTITITLSGAGDGAMRGRKARGNEPDTDNGNGGSTIFDHGLHGDRHGMGDDQIPPPHTATPDLATLLGAHVQFGEYWA